MLHIKSLDDGLELFKALGSEIRVTIIKTLLANQGMNMNELASSLNITNGALTSHIKKLEDCGIVTISSESSGHGNEKRCSVHLDKILIDVDTMYASHSLYETDIKVGQYCDYYVFPTCGLAAVDALIGEVDNPRYFAHPDRIKADILWFTKRYVEYIIPNFIPTFSKIDQITISAELGSEAPGTNNFWPSDIHFYLNDICLGCWTSPGDFGDVRGIFNPAWWFSNWNQYGLLKLIVINGQGTYIDGVKISDVSLQGMNLDYTSQLKLKFAVPETARHVGGLTIFGSGFGNYNQDIRVGINYSPMSPPDSPTCPAP